MGSVFELEAAMSLELNSCLLLKWHDQHCVFFPVTCQFRNFVSLDSTDLLRITASAKPNRTSATYPKSMERQYSCYMIIPSNKSQYHMTLYGINVAFSPSTGHLETFQTEAILGSI